MTASRIDGRGDSRDDEEAHPGLAVLARGTGAAAAGASRCSRLLLDSSSVSFSTIARAASAAARRSAKARTTGSSLARNSAGVPTKRSLPWVSRATRSEISSACSMSWVTTMDVTWVRSRISRMRREIGGGVDGVEAGDRLVVEQDLGPAHDGAGQAHALAHAARELGGELLQDEGGVEVHVLERVADLAQHLGRARPPRLAVGQADHDVLEDVHRVEERRVLEDVAHLAPDLLRARPGPSRTPRRRRCARRRGRARAARSWS